jgi:hypothetical protein
MELKLSEERMRKTGVAYDEHLGDFVGDKGNPPTGGFVRAVTPGGKWVTADIALLDKDSLLAWLKSRGGDNPWAENIAGVLLGHGNLHPEGAESGYTK